MKYYLVLFVAMMSAGAVFSQKEKAGKPLQTVHLVFKNVVGNALLQTGMPYTNPHGEPFTVRSFKYYISNIQLQYANGSAYQAPIYPHLVNEVDSVTKNIAFDAPAGTVSAIRFLIGVDSAANVTGVQTGDLDPAKGMYWVWNTGYIMAKLEGTSPAARTPGRQFTYDVGGYKKGEVAARQIYLSIPPYKASRVLATITIKADVSKWFEGAHAIKIGEQPTCHEPGARAMQLADNYAQMFAVE